MKENVMLQNQGVASDFPPCLLQLLLEFLPGKPQNVGLLWHFPCWASLDGHHGWAWRGEGLLVWICAPSLLLTDSLALLDSGIKDKLAPAGVLRNSPFCSQKGGTCPRGRGEVGQRKPTESPGLVLAAAGMFAETLYTTTFLIS